MQSYHHFTLSERESLRISRKEGKSIRKIAQELGRSPSSVSRELKRNLFNETIYNPWNSTFAYLRRRKNSKRKYRLCKDTDLKKWVIEKLQHYWSPEIIAKIWVKTHPEQKLSASTIYRALKLKLLEDVRAETHLRRHNKRKYCNEKNKCYSVKPIYSIDDRPIEANGRLRIGDWECDTVFGGVGKGYLVTCVDRKSRYMLACIAKNKTSECVNKALVKALKRYPVKTITLDNGSEFADFKTIEKKLSTTVYFAKLHAPWQRGTNENLNGCIRFFFPRGTDFRNMPLKRLSNVLELLNNRPRKCLNWLSPCDVFYSKCCT